MNFYNGSGKSGAKITAENADDGHAELGRPGFGAVFLLEIFTTRRPDRPRPTAPAASPLPTQPQFAGATTTDRVDVARGLRAKRT